MRTYRQLGEIKLGFEWHGGPYIEVCLGEAFASPKEVINVWDYEADKPAIVRTREALNAKVNEWIEEYGRDNLVHDVTQNWRFG